MFNLGRGIPIGRTGPQGRDRLRRHPGRRRLAILFNWRERIGGWDSSCLKLSQRLSGVRPLEYRYLLVVRVVLFDVVTIAALFTVYMEG